MTGHEDGEPESRELSIRARVSAERHEIGLESLRVFSSLHSHNDADTSLVP